MISRRAARPPGRDERGFTLMENVMAMTLLFGVLLALLGALGSAANGITNGRQRTVATSLGKQAIEALQGSSYADVAMNLSSSGLSTDPRITGTGATRTFEGELLVGGGSVPYSTTSVMSGITYVLRTYVTEVTPAAGSSYRRITTFVEWTPSTSGSYHQLRFSSLVYPLDYRSYPAASALAEVAGGSVSITGSVGGDTIEELYVSLPSARSTTAASTLRTAHGTAAGVGGVLRLTHGPLSVTGCTAPGPGSAAVECPIPSFDAVADNDVSSTMGSAASGTGIAYAAADIGTPAGLNLLLPGGSSSTRASVDLSAACGFGDGDGVPWADAATASTDGQLRFALATEAGPVTGELFELNGTWTATSSLDHDTTSGGVVGGSASLSTPELTLLTFDAVPGFSAVRVPSFVAAATAQAGHTAASPAASRDTITVQLWDDTAVPPGYRDVSISPTTSVDEIAVSTVVVGADTVTMTSRVLSQPATTSVSGAGLLTAATGQHSPMLLVTVDVVIVGPNASSFTITFDYGSVTAHTGWLEAP